MALLVGTGRSLITPPIGTPLAGFGDRKHGSEGVLDDVEVRAVWLQNGNLSQDAICIVTADIESFKEELAGTVRAELASETGISQERILLSASHTHSGPQVDESVMGELFGGPATPGVVAMIRSRITEAVKSAQGDLHPAVMSVGRGSCEGYAINRRLWRDGEVAFAPNPDGVRDDEVMVISFHDESDHTTRAVLFQFTCHPSTMDGYVFSADYPGAARRYIEAKLGDNAVAAFIPGCFGDIRANTAYLGGREFRPGFPQDIAEFGAALGGEVLRIIRESTNDVSPMLDVRTDAVELALQHNPNPQDLERIAGSDEIPSSIWAKYLLSTGTYTSRTFSIQRIDLAKHVMLVAMNGEVVCEYGRFIKALRPDIFAVPIGYSNGSQGYIPTADMLTEGGYEADESHKWEGLPSAYTPEIEESVKKALSALIGCSDS